MLRRKLLVTLGSLVVLLVATTVGAIWMLERVLVDLEHVQGHAAMMSDEVSDLGRTITSVEVELYELDLGHEQHLDPLIDEVESLNQLVGRLQEHYGAQGELGTSAGYDRIRAALPDFEAHIGELATTRDPALVYYHTHEAMKISVAIRREALAMGEAARSHAQGEREALVSRFRWLVLGLAIVFLLVIDVAVMVLWRTALTILRPVGKLIEASRQLADENFAYRVRLDGKDEFDELARAHNRLAEQLQAHEQRKVEVLVQAATTMNHELNNALAIIELQLTLLQESVHDSAGQEKCLRQIRENLQRMARTVHSLKAIRRVVLTDYAGGEKMLDLERSVREEPPAPQATSDAKRVE
jgi:signal transduction histidine kinase